MDNKEKSGDAAEVSRRDDLFYKQKNGYDLLDMQERLALESYCDGYKSFLNAARTEREAVVEAVALAESAGFVPFTPDMELKPGARLYRSIGGKALLLAVVGEKPLNEGVNIAAAHVDAPGWI
jgi:aspartyl aminopeptidase